MARLVYYPRWRSIGLMAAGAPVSVLAAVLGAPWLWTVSLLWVAAVVLALCADAFAASVRAALAVTVEAPQNLEAGGSGEAEVTITGIPAGAVDLALEATDILAVEPQFRHGLPVSGRARFRLVPRRRGRALIRNLHLRWTSPLRLVWLQHVERLDRVIDIVPKVSAVRDEADRLFSRTREQGAARQLELAPSMAFHALREFTRGDDSRAVAWRQSARHQTLLVRDTQAERNRSIVFAFDTGRLMCEPLDGGLPRIDHAINAAMLMAFVALKGGDRVGLFAFDARPGVASGAAAGVAAFGPLQRLAATIDYTTEETNFTLAMSRLTASLRSRALVIIFTEFADTTSATLMVESIGCLIERHVVLFVVFEDSELEALVRAEPLSPADVSRAVVAGGLLREREAVLGRLRRLGVEILDVPARALAPSLVQRYLTLKRQDRL